MKKGGYDSKETLYLAVIFLMSNVEAASQYS